MATAVATPRLASRRLSRYGAPAQAQDAPAPSQWAAPDWDAIQSNQPDVQSDYTAPAAPAPAAGGLPNINVSGNVNRTPNFSPNTQTDDINRMWRDNRTAALEQGDRIGSDLANQEQQRFNMESGYRDTMNNAYNQLWNEPGYTNDEKNAIIREDDYRKGVAGQGAYDALNPTDEEYRGMMGNPNDYYASFNPSKLEQADADSASFQRGQFRNAEGRLTQSVDQQRSDYDKAIDPSKLGLSPDYAGKIGADVGGGAAAVRAALDPNKLRLSDEFINKYKMSDQDVQGMENRAATNVANYYGARRGDIERGAAAAGNADYLATAAALNRTRPQEAAGISDARLNAELEAKKEQASRLKDIEGMRLGAESGYSGLATANEQQLAGRQLAADQDLEKTRLGAQQDISNRQMTAASDIGNASRGVGQYLGTTGVGMEQGIGQQASNTGQFNTRLGTQIAEDVENANANRQAQAYNNRVGLGQFGINTQYSQNMGVNNALSQSNQNVANQRITGQNNYRDWATGQTNTQAQLGQNATGQRIQNYGTQTGATNAATSGLSNWEIGNQGNTPLAKAQGWVGTLTGAAKAASPGGYKVPGSNSN